MSAPETIHTHHIAPVAQPNILSPHTRGYILGGTWPPLFWGPERLPEMQRKIQEVPWARELLGTLQHEADAVCSREPQLPIEPIGWRHDYYSPDTAEHLLFNPDQAVYRDPHNQVEWTGEPYRKAWVLQIHERTYRLMRSLACLYRLTGKERYGHWAAEGLAKAVNMFARTDLREQNKNQALYFQPLYDSQVLALIANTCSLLHESPMYTKELHAAVTATIFEASMPLQISFMESRGAHNMTCYVDACLVFAGVLLGRTDWLELAVYHPTGGFQAMLRDGLARDAQGEIDGFWSESVFYHFYSVCPLLSIFALMQSPAWPEDKVPVTHISSNPETEHTLSRMLLAPAEMADQTLRLPIFGDLGAPRHMKLGLYKHLYEMGTGVLASPDLPVTLGAIYDGVHGTKKTRACMEALAFGPDYVKKERFSPVSVHLPATGAVFLRDDTWQTFLKCGVPPHGHAHQDMLSLGVTAYNTQVITDLGTAGYAARPFYDFCRSAVSHSTILVDDNEKQLIQKASLVPFLSEHKAEAQLLLGPCGVQLQREMELAAPFVYLTDTCSANEMHTYTWLIHPYGSAVVTYAGDQASVGIPPLPQTGSFVFLTDRHSFSSSVPVCVDWRVAENLWLRCWTWCDVPFTCTLAYSPGNPRPDGRTTLALRCKGTRVTIESALEIYETTPQMQCSPFHLNK